MSTEFDKAKETIRQLFARAADDASADSEIDAALMYARRLMLRHNIEEEDLEEKARTPDEIAADEEYGQVQAFPFGKRLCQFEGILSVAICELVGSVQAFQAGWSEKRTSIGAVKFKGGRPETCSSHIVFYGPEDDCREARSLFHQWSLAICAAARLKFGTFAQGAGRNYAEGFAGALFSKVQKIVKAEKTKIEGAEVLTRDLVLVGQAREVIEAKKAAGSDYLERETGVKLRKRRSVSSGSWDPGAFSAGRKDGERAEFSRRTRQKQIGS